MSDKFALIIPVVPAREVASTSDELRDEMGARGSNQDIRRPLDALTLPDDSYATISLLSGGKLKNTSVATGTSSSNANILIQSLSYSVTEKHQRAQTFDRDRLFFFGQALPSLSISAKTLDTLTFQWLQELYENYATRIGGSISAERGAKVQITSDNRVYTGYILNLNFAKNSLDRYAADISFNMSLTNLKHLKRLRSTVDEKDLGQVSIEKALQGVSDILKGSNGAGAETDTSLAAQSATTSPEAATPVTAGSYAFKDIYVNEYPNRSYGTLTQRSFVVDPVAPEQAKLPESLAAQTTATFEDILDFQTTYGVGVTVLPTGTDGVSVSDIENPFIKPIPAVAPETDMFGADITDDVQLV
jgi:hypothetical protein